MSKTIKHYFLPIAIVFTILPIAAAFTDEFEDLFNDPAINYLVDHTNFHAPNARSPIPPAECLIDIGAAEILQIPIYCWTYPLVERSLLDYWTFLPTRLCYEREWTLGGHLFYNETLRKNFTKNSTAICSYLAIQNPTLLERLNDCADPLQKFLPLSPADLLSLFSNFTVSERRTGMMFHGQRQWGSSWRFYFMTPFYYLERNFFATEEEQEEIERVLGSASQDDVEDFAKKHLISDKVGIGDTRMTLDKNVYVSENFELKLGALVTIPTAFTMGKGFLGSSFKRVTCRPTLDIEKLFYQIKDGTKQDQQAAQAEGEAFAMGILDNLAANLLDTKLGNHRHIGFGGYYETQTRLGYFIKLPWATNFTICNRVSLEYLLPKTELRWFIECDNSHLFEALGLDRTREEIVKEISDNPAYAKEILNFMQDQLVDRLYPFAFQASVHPGLILRSTTKFCYEIETWGFFLGGDFWLATAEKINNVIVKRESDNRPPNINIRKAQKPRAYEGEVIGGVYWNIPRKNHQWLLGLNAGGTYVNSGVGENYTLSFNVEVNF